MGWLAIGLVVVAFLFGVLVGVLAMAMEPRERGDLLAPLTQQPDTAIDR